MDAFWDGFEKQAVTLGYINKKMSGGILQRAGMDPNKADHLKALHKKVKGLSDSMLHAQGHDTSKHWRAVEGAGGGGLASVRALNKSTKDPAAAKNMADNFAKNTGHSMLGHVIDKTKAFFKR